MEPVIVEDAGSNSACAASDLQLRQRAVVIAIAVIKMCGAGEMRFAGVGRSREGLESLIG